MCPRWTTCYLVPKYIVALARTYIRVPAGILVLSFPRASLVLDCLLCKLWSLSIASWSTLKVGYLRTEAGKHDVQHGVPSDGGSSVVARLWFGPRCLSCAMHGSTRSAACYLLRHPPVLTSSLIVQPQNGRDIVHLTSSGVCLPLPSISESEAISRLNIWPNKATLTITILTRRQTGRR